MSDKVIRVRKYWLIVFPDAATYYALDIICSDGLLIEAWWRLEGTRSSTQQTGWVTHSIPDEEDHHSKMAKLVVRDLDIATIYTNPTKTKNEIL